MLGFTEGRRRVAVRAMLGWMLGALLAGAVGIAWAAAPRSLRFEHLGLEQGLSQESVLNVLQDRRGFMWFGTQAGLNRFDGYRITVFRNDPADAGSIADNYVNASYEDASGRLWFGTKGGLTRFDQASQKFVRYLPQGASQPLAPNNSVTAIIGDGRSGLWLATGDGLKRFDSDSGRFTTFRHDGNDPGSLRDDRVKALALDAEGGLWVGTGAGLDRLAPGATRFEHFDIAPPAEPLRNTVLALSIGPGPTLWVGTAAGLEAWRLGAGAPQRRQVGAAEGMGSSRILALYHDAGANLWVGTELDGLKWRAPASARFVTYRNEPLDRHSLADNQVGAVCVDRTGELWVGTGFGGVSRVDLASGGFSRINLAAAQGPVSGIGNSKVRAITGAAGGRLWIGATGGGLSLFDPASGSVLQQLRHDPQRAGSLPDDVVTALATANGRLWVGTPRGLWWRDPASARFKTLRLGTESNSNHINRLLPARSGGLWIATRGGLHALGADGRTVRSWRHDPRDPSSLGDDYGFALLEDRHGMLWIGTDYGLDRFDPGTGKFTHFRHDPANPASLRHSRVYYLMESRSGDLWVGTASGLHRLEAGAGGEARFRFFPATKGQAAAPIGAMLEDAHGQLWVSTTVGISRLDPATGQFKSYTAKDGLIDGSYFVGSAWRGADGQLYFGGVHGMTSFLPEAIRDNLFPPALSITGFSVLNRPRALDPEGHAITLSQRDSVFTLEFAALHYADPMSNRYAYRLEGFDDTWVSTDAAKRFATYANLDPGRYVFQVRASNKDGVWSETPAALEIIITPPLWKAWWFRTLALLLAVAMAYALYRLRIGVLVRQKGSLEREVGARTAELVLQKVAAERRKQEAEQQKEVVEQAHRDIALLSDIGRRLTANLDSGAIMESLHAHVHQLMDAGIFGVALVRAESGVALHGTAEYRFAVVDGKRCTPSGAASEDPLAAWCIETGREVLIDDLAADCGAWLGAASDPQAVARQTLPSREVDKAARRAVLYVPIVVATRVLGVVMVQSFERGAYRRVHVDMLRTLAAYAGIAFDNADAYRRLKEAQAQLAAREKLASLGSLVAGVAHELNTPIGNSLLMASALQEKSCAMVARVEASSLRRSDLAAWAAESQEASTLIMRSLHNAAELVNSFKQVAVDQASAQQRRFDLAQACHEIVATLMNQVRLAGHTLELRVPGGIAMDSFPGPLGQVIINFVNNALLHAFDQPGGRLLLTAAARDDGRVRIEFRDDGCGIDAPQMARIFDPFYTTRMGQGGTGLGMNIAYNIVTSLLGGTIQVESAPGGGTAFILDLPVKTPRRTPA